MKEKDIFMEDTGKLFVSLEPVVLALLRRFDTERL